MLVADVTVVADVTAVDGKMLSLAIANIFNLRTHFVVLYKVCHKPFNINIELLLSSPGIFFYGAGWIVADVTKLLTEICEIF